MLGETLMEPASSRFFGVLPARQSPSPTSTTFLGTLSVAMGTSSWLDGGTQGAATCSAVLGQHRSRRRDTDTWQEPATNPLGFFLHQGPYGCPGSVPFGDIHTGKEGRGNKPYMQVRRGLREPCCPPQTTDTLLYHPGSGQSLNSGSVWDPFPHGVTVFTPRPPHHSPTPALLLLRCASEGKDPDSPTPPAHPSPTFQLLSQGWQSPLQSQTSLPPGHS